MLMRTLPICPVSHPEKARTAFPGRWLALSFLTVLLMPARPAFPSINESVSAATAASAPATAGASGDLPPLVGLRLDAPAPAGAGRLRSDFKAEYSKDPLQLDGAPSFVLQRTEYGGGRYGLFAEMGDIRISQTLNTVQEAAGRGGRFGFLTGSSGNSARFETFAASGAHGKSHDDMMVGATGEVTLLDKAARFKTIVVSSRQALDAQGRWPDSGERKGDVVGFLAVLDPFQGKLAAEAEFDYSVFDGNTADAASALHDSACRVKLGGGWGSSRYTALYERTGPKYRLMANRAPTRDSEGVSLAMVTALQLHAFDLKLSRYNNNTGKNELYPRLYRYEGFVDYRFKGFKAVPLALQYKRTLVDSSNEPSGYLPKEMEEEAISGQMNYLLGRWDLGVRGALSQRMNKLSQQRETAAHTVGFLPRFAAGAVTVAPDLSVKRVTDFSANQRTDYYTLDLGLNGSLLKKLDYEVKGGFRRETTRMPGTGRQVVGAKVKAAYPLARYFNWTGVPSLGIKGEYKGIDNRALDRRENDFSLLISLDGVKFM